MKVSCFGKIIIIGKIAIATFIDSARVVMAGFLPGGRNMASKVIHGWARKILKILQVRYTIFNPYQLEFSKERPYILMSNHCSHIDIPLIYETFPHDLVAMIAKKELFRIPLFGRGMRIGGGVSIDRENMRQAVKDLGVARKNMLAGVRLWVAPEGTRSSTGEMGKFKKGGFKVAKAANAIIVPITIVGSGGVLPAKTLEIHLKQTVAIYIGKHIDTANYPEGDCQRLMDEVKQEITKHLNH